MGRMDTKRKLLLIGWSSVLVFNLWAQRPVVLDPSYEHTKWGIEPSDHHFEFAAFTASFDGLDDNDGDGDSDAWGIPEWVAYEIKGPLPRHLLTDRPKWFTDEDLHNLEIAPDDDTYHVAGTRRLPVVKTDYRYVRGHMCPKFIAERISRDAAYNTHTMINAVPQLQWQNNGVWKYLEIQTGDWADRYGRIWVVCGPVFFNHAPAIWLGQDGEVKSAVPDALFKIVIREDSPLPKVLAFIIPNVIPKEEDDYWEYLSSIDDIEELTGLDFMAALPESHQDILEEDEGLPEDWR